MLPNEKKSRLSCLGSDKKVICKSSECVERRNPERRISIYPLKVCYYCSVSDAVRIWNRDVKTAKNICSILTNYISSNFNIQSRLESLQRGTRAVQDH
ncbi:hypothetical protein BCV72DRAFT_91810 [Rhizopus microsporus var. microsporus]|uniref:Uncharacterized protein n=1 Tax=Rhizopus microsporus var. microsporus TaxID=86635 RepID=A0A1X0R8I5_RHIZD|nr:hypothetical protein BCV72DRAFT_91810 [Rhizopus microsporus var. microsporus]